MAIEDDEIVDRFPESVLIVDPLTQSERLAEEEVSIVDLEPANRQDDELRSALGVEILADAVALTELGFSLDSPGPADQDPFVRNLLAVTLSRLSALDLDS